MAKFHYRESPTFGQKKAFAPYLSEDEELVLVTGLSNAYLRNKFLVFFLFPGILFLAAGAGAVMILGVDKILAVIAGIMVDLLVTLLHSIHLYHSHRYLLTTKRVIIKKGLFNVKLTAALFDKITHLEVDQSFIDRILLHHGNIIINTAGLNKGEIILESVDYPLEIKNLLERLINREREGLGLRSVSVSAVEGEILD
ncbi:MAG: PH domain-containing protein [Candidatus Daviesbacteria bacterium]|nr:MAG: PH domain-containing protein [Candidatus Daviesbacteria bacterium]